MKSEGLALHRNGGSVDSLCIEPDSFLKPDIVIILNIMIHRRKRVTAIVLGTVGTETIRRSRVWRVQQIRKSGLISGGRASTVRIPRSKRSEPIYTARVETICLFEIILFGR